MIYRLTKFDLATKENIQYRGMTIDEAPIYVSTQEQLNVDLLFKDGIAAKLIDYELPEYGLNGQKINVIPLGRG